MGFVRPLTVRPVSGVWARVSSLPVPPRRFVAVVLRAVLIPRALAFWPAGFPLFRPLAPWPAARAFPFGVLAPAVLRPVLRLALAVRFVPAPLLAAARAPAPPRLFDGVRF